jgi:V/A-type H+-transporting ATPase subunit D
MPELLDVAPTRGNLLELQDQLERIREGHGLLDRKREVLTRELLDMIADAEAIQEEARERFKVAYAAMQEARMRIGVNRIRWINLAPAAKISAQVSLHSIMGVMAPLVDVEVRSLPLPYSPGDTSATLDRARERWLEVAGVMGKLVEVQVTVWRLAVELRRTQRRVHALEQIVIPRYKATVDFISASLEEEDREDILHAKMVKERH